MMPQLFDVFPHTAVSNVTHLTVGAPEAFADFVGQERQRPNFTNHIGAQSFPHRTALHSAPLHRLIRNVIGVGAQEKMIGVDAVPYVAFVQDLHPIRNRAVRNLPRPAMSCRRSPAKHQPPVPALIAMAAPKNAARLRVRARVKREPIRQRALARRHFACVFGHSLNCSNPAIVGQGRCPRFNAARPVPYSMIRGVA